MRSKRVLTIVLVVMMLTTMFIPTAMAGGGSAIFSVYNQCAPSDDHGYFAVTYNGGAPVNLRAHQSANFTYVMGVNTISIQFFGDPGWEFDRDTNIGGAPSYYNPGTRYVSPNDTTNIHPQWDRRTSYTIDTSVTGGSITGDQTVYKGDNCTIDYSPNAGYHLVSVTVDGINKTTSNPNSYTFSNVTANHTISVVYAINTYTVDTAVTGGTITPDQTVNSGSSSTISYNPNAGYHLVSVTVDGADKTVSNPNSYTFTNITANHAISVVYAANIYTIDTTVSGGTITSDQNVTAGSSSTISFSPSEGYHLVSVTVDGTDVTASNPDSYTFTNVMANHTISVVYDLNSYMIDTEATGGTITPDTLVSYNGSLTVDYSPFEHYHLVSVTVDGVDATATNPDSYTFSGVTTEHTISVVYAIDTNLVDTDVTNGNITPDQNVGYNGDVTIDYSPFEHYHLVSVTADGVDVTATNPDSYTFSGVITGYTISVVYAIDTYLVDTDVTNGTISPDQNVDYNGNVTVDYSPFEHYHLVSVTADGLDVTATNPGSYTFSGVTTGHTISVVYAIDTNLVDTDVTNGSITPDQSVDYNGNVTIGYSPFEHYHLVSVTADGVDVTATNPDSYTFSGVTSGHTISVVYSIDTNFVDTSVTNGTITPGRYVDYNGDITVDYTPFEHYHLVSVAADGVDVTAMNPNSYTFSGVVTGHTISVVYAIDTNLVDTDVANGSITPDQNVDYNGNVTVDYSPFEHYHLVSVTVDGVDVTATNPDSYTFSGVTTGHTISVVYAIDTNLVDTEATNGTITPDQNVVYNGNVTIDYSPSEHYHLVSVIVDGVDVTATNPNSYTFSGVTSGHTISALYAIDTNYVNTSVTNGNITPDQSVDYNGNVTIDYNPSEHYHLLSVTVDGVDVTATNPASYTFGGVTAGHTISVIYAIDTFMVKYNLGANGTTTDAAVFDNTPYGNKLPGAPDIIPNPGWKFTGWAPSLPGYVTGDAIFNAQYTRIIYTVRFFRADGVTQIGTSQTVNWGGAAVLETAPVLAGRTFAGWRLTGDKVTETVSLSNVRANIDAVAAYTVDTVPVTFVDYNGARLGIDNVPYGGNAVPPANPEREGYTFTGWSSTYNNVTGALTVTALYRINTYKVVFADYNGTVLSTQSVEWNAGATAPAAPALNGFTFKGWDVPFDTITHDIIVKAQYSANPQPSSTPEPMQSPEPSVTPVPSTEQPSATPAPTQITEEPVPQAGTSGSWAWWLLLIPAAGILWLLFAAMFKVIPIAEEVTENKDGTFTVKWGYENRKPRKYKAGEDKSILSVISGKLISSSSKPPVEFEKGRVRNVFTTVVSKNATIQWKINDRKAEVNISKLDK